MDEWEEYYKKSNNFAGAPNQNNYSIYYFGYMNDYVNGNNMSPGTYNECFAETTATTKLKKWTKIYKICSIVLLIILIVFGIVGAYDNSFIIVEGKYSWQTVTRFSIGYFIGYLLGYGIFISAMFLSFKLVCAALNCLAQISRNTGISAKLAAFNARNQMMKDASKEKEN